MATSQKLKGVNYNLLMHLMTIPDKDNVGSRWSKQEIQIFYQSYMANKSNLKKILVDLIEEDFTSRAFDNIKALNTLAQDLIQEYHNYPSHVLSEEDFVVSHLDQFFKYRNKISDLEQLADVQEEQEQRESLGSKQRGTSPVQRDDGHRPVGPSPSQSRVDERFEYDRRGPPSHMAPQQHMDDRYGAHPQQAYRPPPGHYGPQGHHRPPVHAMRQPRHDDSPGGYHPSYGFTYSKSADKGDRSRSRLAGMDGPSTAAIQYETMMQQQMQLKRPPVGQQQPSQSPTEPIRQPQRGIRQIQASNFEIGGPRDRERERERELQLRESEQRERELQQREREDYERQSIMQHRRMFSGSRGEQALEHHQYYGGQNHQQHYAQQRDPYDYRQDMRQMLSKKQEPVEYTKTGRVYHTLDGDQIQRIQDPSRTHTPRDYDPQREDDRNLPQTTRGAGDIVRKDSTLRQGQDRKEFKEDLPKEDRNPLTKQLKQPITSGDDKSMSGDKHKEENNIQRGDSGRDDRTRQQQSDILLQKSSIEEQKEDLQVDRNHLLIRPKYSNSDTKQPTNGQRLSVSDLQLLQNESQNLSEKKKLIFKGSKIGNMNMANSGSGIKMLRPIPIVQTQADNNQPVQQANETQKRNIGEIQNLINQSIKNNLNGRTKGVPQKQLTQGSSFYLNQNGQQEGGERQFIHDNYESPLAKLPQLVTASAEKIQALSRITQAAAAFDTKRHSRTINGESDNQVVAPHLPSQSEQRSHLTYFIDNMLEKHYRGKEKGPFDQNGLGPNSNQQEETRRGIGYLLDQIIDISQLIPDERPLDNPEVLESENPKKVLKIQKLLSDLTIRWFTAEYFYSYIDKPWFQENELVETLDEAGLPIELNKREWAIIRKSFVAKDQDIGDLDKNKNRPRRLFSKAFLTDERKKLQRYRHIFREVMQQYLQQGVYLDTGKEELSEFQLDYTKLLSEDYSEEEIQHAYYLIKKNRSLPMVVSQQVLAFHPQLRQLRTASLLTTYGNRYHVLYHNPDLGVHLQLDRSITPIGPSELYHSSLDEADQIQDRYKDIYQDNRPVNQTRNQLLWQGMSLAGQQPLVSTLLNQVEEGSRKKQFLPVEQTEYTNENKKAMALLLMLIERKDYITNRLAENDSTTQECQSVIERMTSQANKDTNTQNEQDGLGETIKLIEQAQQELKQAQTEQTWLYRHLQLTNEAIWPVLNVTRLKHVKNSPFGDDDFQDPNDIDKDDRESVESNQKSDIDQSEEHKQSPSVNDMVDIMILPGGAHRVVKPTVALDQHTKEGAAGVGEVVRDIAKLFESFYDVQVVSSAATDDRDNGTGDNQIDHEMDAQEAVEDQLTEHKETLLEKLASLNRQSVEGLVKILERKTSQYTEQSKDGQITQLMDKLKSEMQRALIKLSESKNEAEGQTRQISAEASQEKQQDDDNDDAMVAATNEVQLKVEEDVEMKEEENKMDAKVVDAPVEQTVSEDVKDQQSE